MVKQFSVSRILTGKLDLFLIKHKFIRCEPDKLDWEGYRMFLCFKAVATMGTILLTYCTNAHINPTSSLGTFHNTCAQNRSHADHQCHYTPVSCVFGNPLMWADENIRVSVTDLENRKLEFSFMNHPSQHKTGDNGQGKATSPPNWNHETLSWL